MVDCIINLYKSVQIDIAILEFFKFIHAKRNLANSVVPRIHKSIS